MTRDEMLTIQMRGPFTFDEAAAVKNAFAEAASRALAVTSRDELEVALADLDRWKYWLFQAASLYEREVERRMTVVDPFPLLTAFKP